MLEICEETLLFPVLKDHVLHKLLWGPHFEDVLQTIAKMCLLAKNNGILLAPELAINLYYFKDLLTSKVSFINYYNDDPLSFSSVEAHLNFSNGLIAQFALELHTAATKAHATKHYQWPSKYDAAALIRRFFVKYCGRDKAKPCAIQKVGLGTHTLSLISMSRIKQQSTSYNVLKYDYSHNIGDEMQGLAAIQFLPHIDEFIARDNMTEALKQTHSEIIMNGWWRHFKPWSLSSSLKTVMTSIHSKGTLPLNTLAKHLNYTVRYVK